MVVYSGTEVAHKKPSTRSKGTRCQWPGSPKATGGVAQIGKPPNQALERDQRR